MSGRYDSTAGREREPRIVPAQQARQAVPLGHIRYVLGGGLALAVAAGLIIWFGFFY